MTKLQALKVAALASACCLLQFPVLAHAQDDNGGFEISAAPAQQAQQPAAAPGGLTGSVTIGIGAVSGADENGYFGRYNGMKDSGAGFIGSFDLQSRDPWDSGGNHYFSFTGDNIDFGFGYIAPEANLELKTGHQGEWGIDATYDAMTYTATDRFTTILDKEGNLAPGYMAAVIANGAFLNNSPTLSSFYGPGAMGGMSGTLMTSYGNHVPDYGPSNALVYQIGTRRDKGTITGHYVIGDWLISAAISHEHKEGTLEEAMGTGMGDNTFQTTFPMPIDYDTDNYAVTAAYTTDRFQAQFSYRFSNFIDHKNGGYNFEGWNFAAVQDPTTLNYTSYEQNGVYSLPPSNQAHLFTAKLGYTVTPTTRITGTASYGLQLQNDPFVAATGSAYVLTDPVMAAELASNPTSLNGEVNTYFGKVAVTSHPLSRLDVRASYTINVRDPQTKAMWIYGDPTDDISLQYRQAVPESWNKQAFVLDAGYYVLSSTRINVGYAYRDAHRGHAITRDTRENEESIKIHSMLSPSIIGSLGYVHSNRTASAPDWSLWLVQIPSECGGPTVNDLGCQQIPFYEAARTHDAVTALVSGMIGQKATLSVFGKYSANRYHDPEAVYNGSVNPSLGINRDYSVQVGPDFTYQIGPDEQLRAFYTFLRTYRAMRGLNDQSDPTGGNYYSEASTYDIHTVGFGGTWHCTDKVKLTADYTYSYGDQGFRQSGTWDIDQAGQTFGGDPSLGTRSSVHRLDMHATYDYSPSTSFYLGYRFDSLDMTDWALVPASRAATLTTGDIVPRYNVHTVIAAMTMKM